jgi:hypothetical protein
MHHERIFSLLKIDDPRKVKCALARKSLAQHLYDWSPQKFEILRPIHCWDPYLGLTREIYLHQSTCPWRKIILPRRSPTQSATFDPCLIDESIEYLLAKFSAAFFSWPNFVWYEVSIYTHIFNTAQIMCSSLWGRDQKKDCPYGYSIGKKSDRKYKCSMDMDAIWEKNRIRHFCFRDKNNDVNKRLLIFHWLMYVSCWLSAP